jgi:hypothetical protein
MEMDEKVWNHAVYSKNRERLLNEEIAESFFQRVLERAKPYMSDEHFTVDGTLIEAWASHKSFRPKDGTGKPPDVGGDVDFCGEKRKNQTHESTTDPDARLFTKSSGSQAKLSYMLDRKLRDCAFIITSRWFRRSAPTVARVLS